MQAMTPAMPQVEQGSTGLGFLAGFFGGILGLVLVLVLAKGKNTKRGAIYGIGGQVLLGILGGVFVAIFVLRAAPPVSTPAAATATAITASPR